MTLFFPSAISLLGVTKVSISRIQTFLRLEEFSVENDRRYLKSTTEVISSFVFDLKSCKLMSYNFANIIYTLLKFSTKH